MYTTYHLSSAQELNADILEAIKATFQSKPITIIVEEDEDSIGLTDELKSILDQRLLENPKEDLSSGESIEMLKRKHGL